MQRNFLHCKKCPLKGHEKVFGEGDIHSPIAFVGMNPGEQERKQKRPFVGPAGIRLNKALHDAGIKRETVWITNVVKCYLPFNQDPSTEAGEVCSGLLKDELQDKALIVPLGAFALKCIKKFMPDLQGELFPMIHPAATKRKGIYEAKLRQQTKQLKKKLEEWPVSKGGRKWPHGKASRKPSNKGASS